ncbi:class D sortase [Ammoniphilus sp. YIM 78166]|uniref:class D sortase n=1 Tax=Ammoniphilus sp. YIM 78166 TaxID=1644106 RepID=UPI001F0E748B|nr:class D sortase [Ammoniphilus sp. YIM 78166]
MKLLVKGGFFLSLLLMVISFYQISLADDQVQAGLEEWEDVVGYVEVIEGEEIVDEVEVVAEVDRGPPPLYSKRPKQGELIGKVEIPKLKESFPLIEGTGNKELAKGVGHYIGSVLPGESDNAVIAGHRDTVFRRLGEVEVGDVINVQTVAGTFSYHVIEQRIVDKEDRTVIVPHSEAILTVVTCYPFDYVGAAPNRYILTAKLK